MHQRIARTRPRHRVSLLCTLSLIASSPLLAFSQEQYPPPLLHTPSNHPARRVLLITVDDLHALDLANWIASNPTSTLSRLSARGVTYTNAHVPWPDPAAGLVSLVTGGTPISTGILSLHGYDRALSPPGSGCTMHGAAILPPLPFAHHPPSLTSPSSPSDPITPSSLPLDASHGCVSVPPHALVRVNNIFEAVRATGGRTAWAGQSAQLTDILEGPSGQGLDEACAYSLPASETIPDSADDAPVIAVINWISGHDCSGKAPEPVPTLFGMSFVVHATPTHRNQPDLSRIDRALGRIVEALQRAQLYDSTWIIFTSSYGRSPLNPTLFKTLPGSSLVTVGESLQSGLISHITFGKLAMIWLSDATRAPALAHAYESHSESLGIAEIYTSSRLALALNTSIKDTRMPDLVLEPRLGVIWKPPTASDAEVSAGLSDDDTHVPLLVSGAQLTPRLDKTWVPISQTAPLLLRSLGMEKFDLQALHLEHTPALPGIF